MTAPEPTEQAGGGLRWGWRVDSLRREGDGSTQTLWVIYKWDYKLLVQVDVAWCFSREECLEIIAQHDALIAARDALRVIAKVDPRASYPDEKDQYVQTAATLVDVILTAEHTLASLDAQLEVTL